MRTFEIIVVVATAFLAGGFNLFWFIRNIGREASSQYELGFPMAIPPGLVTLAALFIFWVSYWRPQNLDDHTQAQNLVLTGFALMFGSMVLAWIISAVTGDYLGKDNDYHRNQYRV